MLVAPDLTWVNLKVAKSGAAYFSAALSATEKLSNIRLGGSGEIRWRSKPWGISCSNREAKDIGSNEPQLKSPTYG